MRRGPAAQRELPLAGHQLHRRQRGKTVDDLCVLVRKRTGHRYLGGLIQLLGQAFHMNLLIGHIRVVLGGERIPHHQALHGPIDPQMQ